MFLFIYLFLCFAFISLVSPFLSKSLGCYKYTLWNFLPVPVLLALYLPLLLLQTLKSKGSESSKGNRHTHIKTVLINLFFFHFPVCCLTWQIFSSYNECGTMLYSWEAYEKRIIIDWEWKMLITYSVSTGSSQSGKPIILFVTVFCKVEVCLKYLWSSLYVFFKYG